MALKFELAAASLRPGYRTNGLVPGENSCSACSISSWSANCERNSQCGQITAHGCGKNP